MVTTFAEYLLAEREGFFEMRPVSHNLISLRCSLSLPPWIRKGMKEISFGSLHFGRRGSMKLVWQELCVGTVSGYSVYSEMGRWVWTPAQGWGGESRGSWWHTSAPKVVRLLTAELTAGLSVCKKASRVRRLPCVPHAYGLISHQDKILGNLFFLARKTDKNDTQVLSSNAEKIHCSLLQTCACLMLGEPLHYHSI